VDRGVEEGMSGDGIEIGLDLGEGVRVAAGSGSLKSQTERFGGAREVAVGFLSAGFVEVGVAVVGVGGDRLVVVGKGLGVVASLGEFLGEAVETEDVARFGGEESHQLIDPIDHVGMLRDSGCARLSA
jgi:hypothetical protein